MSSNNKLFTQFPPVSTQEWEETIIKDLKGADYEKKLVWKTNEHVNVQPYYRAEDIMNIAHLNDDGTFPYAKNNGANWKVRQDFLVKDDSDLKSLKSLIVQSIEKGGVESLGVNFTKCQNVDLEFVRTLCKLSKTTVEVNFICNSDNVISIFDVVMAYLKGEKKKKSNCHIEYDPFNDFISNGLSYMEGIDALRCMINESSDYPDMKVGVVNASYFGNCGATLVEELAFGIGEFADILDFLTETGDSIDVIVKKLKLQLSVGSNYFFEIAKIRTARFIWGQIVNEYKPKDKDSCGVYIHAVTSSWNKSMYDPYVNMLRTTTEAMASVLGGVDSLTVLPFNFVTSENDEFALRIAKNQQLLLKEESAMGKITDPAAGSYYIESLTKEIADRAWSYFLQIVEKGGFIASFKANYIQDIILESSQKRDDAVAMRKESFVGVNQYPNITESIDFDEVSKCCCDVEEPMAGECECSSPKFRTLVPYRGPESFERLRLKTELYTKQTGKRPSVFLFTYGNLAMRIARAGFASNFFGCAGFEIINNNGFSSTEVGVEAAKQSKADIVVICSSDEEYATIAPEIYNGLKDDTIVVVAGNPKECIDALKQAGLKHFIHVKTNILESLTEFQSLIIKE